MSLVLADEAFVALNDVAWTPQGLRENRVFAGPALTGDGWRVELGYLHVLRPGAATQVQHTVMASVFYTL